MKDERTIAVAGNRGSRGAVFWISRAMFTIFRRIVIEALEEIRPKRGRWKIFGLTKVSAIKPLA